MDVQWKAGQRVFALTEGSMPWRKDGTYAGYYAAKEDHLATPAATMTFEEAGATPLAALTAYQVDHPKPCQRQAFNLHLCRNAQSLLRGVGSASTCNCRPWSRLVSRRGSGC